MGNLDPKDDLASSYEPVQVAEVDDKSALIIDFSDNTVQSKTLLDLEEAALMTKAIEPFFLDNINGNLYSWESTGSKRSQASNLEENKS